MTTTTTTAVTTAVTGDTAGTGAATASAPTASVDSGRPEPRAAAACLSDLFRAHGRLVLGICRSLLRDASEAEDAAQQTFLSAYRSLLGGVEPREPAAWLATIARRECWARIRSRMREPLALAGPVQEVPDPLAAALRNDDVAAFWQALSTLPTAQRQAFLLREFGGLSYAELGERLGVSGPAVESLLFRARASLRASLTKVASIAAFPLGLRDRLVDAVPGFEVAVPAAGAAAKVAALPAVLKLAGVGVSVGLVAAGAATVQHARRPHRTPGPAPAAAVHVTRAPGRPAARELVVRSAARTVSKAASPQRAVKRGRRHDQHAASRPPTRGHGREDADHDDRGGVSGRTERVAPAHPSHEGRGGGGDGDRGGEATPAPVQAAPVEAAEPPETGNTGRGRDAAVVPEPAEQEVAGEAGGTGGSGSGESATSGGGGGTESSTSSGSGSGTSGGSGAGGGGGGGGAGGGGGGVDDGSQHGGSDD